MQKYIISGIGPSNLGVGRLVRNLFELNQKNETCIIFKWKKRDEIKRNLKNRRYAILIRDIIDAILNLLKFYLIVLFIKNKEIVLIHPQTLGFNLFLSLIERNRVKWYIMDNSFFCLKSYNHRESLGECLNCVGNIYNCHESCYPFPGNIRKKDNLNFLDKIQKLKNNIEFLVQNESQKKLIHLHFGDKINCKVIGMDTGEIHFTYNRNLSVKSEVNFRFQIVYHGSSIEAKGIVYFIELAKKLPQATFIIPEDKNTVMRKLGVNSTSKNLKFKPCTWETGLKEIVNESFLTICPSLWSSCVEGALLKSLNYGNNVAMVKNDFGFVNDLPGDIVLKLEKDVDLAASDILNAFNNKTFLKNKANKWLRNYVENSKSSISKFVLHN